MTTGNGERRECAATVEVCHDPGSLIMTEKPPGNIHVSVLGSETVEMLNVLDQGVYVDATLGLGGHAEGILRANRTARLIGIDQDREALQRASERLLPFGTRASLVNSNFSQIRSVIRQAGFEKVDGIVADLGVSSLQLDDGERGFSFRFDAPLDMRMDRSSSMPTAADLLASLGEHEIADIIYRFGEERSSRRIARRIVQRRESGDPVLRTKDLAGLIERTVRRSPKDKIHPATRTFQALRIAVNKELDVLEQFLKDGIDSLRTDGRFAVITFHSLEDRIVKQTFQKHSGKCFCPPRMPRCVCGAVNKIEVVTRKPIVAGEDELEKNPRSRSAKLRAVRRIAGQ